MNQIGRWIWASLVVLIMLIGCTQSNTPATPEVPIDNMEVMEKTSDSTEEETPDNMMKPTEVEQPVEERPVKEFKMDSFVEVIDGKYYPQFSVKEITVKKGDLVRLKVTNTKGSHDFRIDEFNVYTETPLDQEMTVEFVADKTGSFVYYCTKPGHRENGQWGTITVVE